MSLRYFYRWAAVACITTGAILLLTSCGLTATIGPDGKPVWGVTIDGAAVAEIVEEKINERFIAVDQESGK